MDVSKRASSKMIPRLPRYVGRASIITQQGASNHLNQIRFHELSWIQHWRNSPRLASPWRKALPWLQSSAPPSRQGDRILRPKIGVLESQHMWLVRWTAPARSAKFIQNGWTEEIRATKSLPCSSIHIPPAFDNLCGPGILYAVVEGGSSWTLQVWTPWIPVAHSLPLKAAREMLTQNPNLRFSARSSCFFAITIPPIRKMIFSTTQGKPMLTAVDLLDFGGSSSLFKYPSRDSGYII